MPKSSAPKPSKKSSKEPAEEPVEEPEVEEPPTPPPAPKKAKKAKKVAEPEPDPEPEPEPEEEPAEEEEEEEAGEEEEDDGEEEESPAKKAKREKARLAAARRKSARVRNNGWRKIAMTAGYTDTKDNNVALASGGDSLKCLLSPADAKRLMTFVPATPGADSFSKEEFKKRADLFKEGVPMSAANETQVRCDAIIRSIMNQAVIRGLEMGKMRITPSVMRSVLRPYVGKTQFTSIVAPIGLVQHAVKKGAISATTNDTGNRAKRTKVASENEKTFDKVMEIKELKKRKRPPAAATSGPAATAA